jgi:hypothetical protein
VAKVAASPVTGGPPAPADTAVYTQRGDNSRVGWNNRETTLNDQNVNARDFGQRVRYPVEGKIYAQPLFVPGLHIDGSAHNVVFVATEDDQVYAFDADAAGPAKAPLWHTSFLVHGATAVPSFSVLHCTSVAPTFGITGTPVIDPATDTMYLVAVTKQGPDIVDSLHAIDIINGTDRLPPVTIQASVHGTGEGSSHGVLRFNAAQEQQHMGLLLSDGAVYIGYSSYCDLVPNHGWILGYRAADLRQVTVYNDTPDSYDGGIWQSATGPAADSSGNIFAITGNGGFDLASGGRDAADAVLKLAPSGGTLKVADYFTPFYQNCLNYHDQDYGSGAPLLLPHEIITVGKEGAIAVLNRSDLGGYRTIANPCPQIARTNVDHVIQEFPPQTVVGGVWSAETYWQGPSAGYVYIAGSGDNLKAWRMSGGKLVWPPSSHARETMVYPGGVPMGSSDGDNPATAIVWIVDQENGPELRAYSAANLADELYSTARGSLPGYEDFALPTVTDGRVFVGSTGELIIYGLLGRPR